MQYQIKEEREKISIEFPGLGIMLVVTERQPSGFVKGTLALKHDEVLVSEFHANRGEGWVIHNFRPMKEEPVDND